MKIQINHLAKMEGHAGFLGHILDNDIAKARIETQEGARLIEGMLIGRHFIDAPIITSRICGICPVVHNLTAIKALENALQIKVTKQTTDLRELMQYSQVIHSHALHLFFLSLPDFYGILNDLQLIKKQPKETEFTLQIRNWSTEMVRIIGGRTIHPIASEIGGFKTLPSIDDLKKLQNDLPSVIEQAVQLAKFFMKLKYPDLSRDTEYLSLHTKDNYAIYTGDIKSNKSKMIKIDQFAQKISEIKKPYDAVKRTKLDGSSFMVGAIARLNNNHQQLQPLAKKILQQTKIKLPTYNSFHNVLAQAIEVVHCLEASQKILDKVLDQGIRPETQQKYQVKACEGVGVVEAPRGMLFHYYRLDQDGFIRDCNVITPTAQFLYNLEDDLKIYLPDIMKMSDQERRQQIRLLIRAYDPCISCATH
ncbi:MAG: Ni/Fe hydrogenase subunit alpha [Candidatus Komeilibacteria bacterium]